MKVLVTGINGQLGHDVMAELERRHIECIGAGRQQFDITDCEAVREFITAVRPDAVIHCSAYTAVDKAESNADACYQANAVGPENIAKVCKAIDAKMVYISTDYVFPGTGEQFYKVDDLTGPINVYGKTKLAGEQAVQRILTKYFIVRISWVFGKNGNNFVKTMLRLGKERENLTVVADQVGSPTYTADLAPLLCDMVATDKYGVYHATNEGVCSWAEFAAEIMQQAGLGCKIMPIPTGDYLTPAKRPLNSRMSKDKLVVCGFKLLPTWQDALSRYLKELDGAEK